MTTILITKDHIYCDTRGTRGSLKLDGFKKFIHDPANMRTYFIVGTAELMEHLVHYHIFGEWFRPEKEKAIINEIKDAALHDGVIDLIVLCNDGHVRSIEVNLDENDRLVFMESLGEIDTEKGLIVAEGSGTPFALGATAVTKDIDIVFKTVSELDQHTSSNYYAVCRKTHTSEYHKGI